MKTPRTHTIETQVNLNYGDYESDLTVGHLKTLIAKVEAIGGDDDAVVTVQADGSHYCRTVTAKISVVTETVSADGTPTTVAEALKLTVKKDRVAALVKLAGNPDLSDDDRALVTEALSK